MNKATLNRRNRERRAKRNQAELPELLEIDREAEDRLLAQIESNIAALSEENQKRLAPKIEDIADKLKKPEKKKDKDSSVESALTAPTGSDVDAFGRPAVSAAVEEALEEEPMESAPAGPFLPSADLDFAPSPSFGNPVPAFDDAVLSSPSYLKAQADMMDAARAAGLDGPPADPRIRSEMFMSAAPEEFEIAAQGPAMEAVAPRDMLQRLAVARSMGSPEFLELYDDLQTAVDRGNPAGSRDGKPRRSLTVDLGRRFDGAKVPESMVRQALRQYAQDYNRIRAGLLPVSGRRSRGRG